MTERDRGLDRASGGARYQSTRGTVGGRGGRGSALDVRGGSYRPRRSGGGRLRGILFLLALAGAVLVGGVVFGGPALAGMAQGWARDNPEALRMPFVADLVKGELGDSLTRPAGTDATPVEFIVAPGATARQVADALVRDGLISERLVFEYLVITRNLTGKLQAGTYTLNRTMTPDQIVAELQRPPAAPVSRIVIELREGLRLEQVTAKLATLDIEMDLGEFYALATDPPAELRADYPFLRTLPEGRSLEGFLAGGFYRVEPTVTPEELIRLMLDQWAQDVPEEVMEAAEASDRDFYEVLTLASIVEKEAVLDEERALIAGVYTNRLAGDIALFADPTVFYGNDTLQLRELDIPEWATYSFNIQPEGTRLRDIELPEELSGYQTYLNRGLPPGPICTPTLDSIQAALEPDTDDGYLFFVAKNDGSRSHAFARTDKEHQANVRKYVTGPRASPSGSPES